MDKTSRFYETINVNNIEILVRFLNTPKEWKELQNEIEANYTKSGEMKFGKASNDIRQKLFSFDQPLFQQTIGEYTYRLTEGLLVDNKKTYLLYIENQIIAEFASPIEWVKKAIPKVVEGIASQIQNEEDILNALDLFKSMKYIADYGAITVDEFKEIIKAIIASKLKTEDLKITGTKTPLKYRKAQEKLAQKIWKDIQPQYKGELQGNRYYTAMLRLIDFENGLNSGMVDRFKLLF